MQELFDSITLFFTNDIYQFVVDVWSWLIYEITLFKVKASIAFMTISWDVAKQLLIDLGITAKLSQAIGFIPADVKSNLEFFKIFTGLDLILQAFVTKFVMKVSKIV